MEQKRKLHDLIVGVLIVVGAFFGYLDPVWILLPGLVGALMIQSYFTGFCPVYFTLDKLEAAGKLPVAK